MAEQYILKKQQWLNNIFERNNNGWKIYFKETTMAEQCVFKNNNGWTMYLKETTMAVQCILRKQQWVNNIILKKQQWLNNVF